MSSRIESPFKIETADERKKFRTGSA